MHSSARHIDPSTAVPTCAQSTAVIPTTTAPRRMRGEAKLAIVPTASTTADTTAATDPIRNEVAATASATMSSAALSGRERV